MEEAALASDWARAAQIAEPLEEALSGNAYFQFRMSQVDRHLGWDALARSARASELGSEDFMLYADLAGLYLQAGDMDPHLLKRGLVDNGYQELPITSAHSLGVAHLPPIHKDPFDRMLLAQAEFEGFLLLTSDAVVAQYPGPVRLV